ncbi:MAG: chromosomal replication initiator protein DnaA [Ignavibacteriales bacterium]|nr:chromosomal replication initiator protein DnaA [Ignavibacteriales bacterium]MCB9258395.1 chromosomal replication initiator protein DnaA [Ignavibacteriales bacterium]
MDNLKISIKSKHKKSVKNSSLIWKECLRIIKQNVSNITYNTWFLPIKPFELEENTLKIHVPNNFFVEWIEEHYNTLINQTIRQVMGHDGKLVYIINDDSDDDPTLFDNPTVEAPKINPKQEENNFETNLSPRYQFDNFIKGESNQLARAAAIAISENPGQTSFNPLFIYGGVGLGKTHLIQAIGNNILKKFPHKKNIYLSADIFTTQFVDAIQSNNVGEFSSFYNNIDVLIIDDIQFLTGREKTQDLFFHIFNNLHQARKQIILSSDRPPKDLKGMSDRLISRFQWGLSADIQAPDFETRIAILKNKGDSFGISLSNEILDYIAYNITSNIRELEGCLIKLLANASLSGKEIDFELTRKTVKEISTRKEANISIDNITKLVCEEFKVDENKVREKNRKKEVVLARQIAMFLSKKLTKASLKTIGLHFGGRDHSTVIHAFNNIEKLTAEDVSLNELVNGLRNKLELGI